MGSCSPITEKPSGGKGNLTLEMGLNRRTKAGKAQGIAVTTVGMPGSTLRMITESIQLIAAS
jgi:hypothetical protein